MVKASNIVEQNHIFIDTNILIGAYSGKVAYRHMAECLHYLTSLKGKKLYISTLSVAQLVATFQKLRLTDKLYSIVKELRHRFEVLSFTKEDIDKSLLDVGEDLEDNMQHVIAKKARCRIIVTENAGDYKSFPDVQTITPSHIRSIPR